MPKKIPVVEKDFIFAAISEELGGIYALCILLICLGCFMQFMLIATRMQALFYKLIAFGLGIEYVVQVFLTIGGVTKFIPSTGVTLPLVSLWRQFDSQHIYPVWCDTGTICPETE